MGVGGHCHAHASLPPGKTRYPFYRRLDGPPGPVWTGAENLAPPTGIRSPDLPGRSESLYRLNYPGPKKTPIWNFIKIRPVEVQLFPDGQTWLSQFCEHAVKFWSDTSILDIIQLSLSLLKDITFQKPIQVSSLDKTSEIIKPVRFGLFSWAKLCP